MVNFLATPRYLKYDKLSDKCSKVNFTLDFGGSRRCHPVGILKHKYLQFAIK